jgi:hypothetical protein
MVTQEQINKKTEEFRHAGWDANHITKMISNWKRRQERKEEEA